MIELKVKKVGEAIELLGDFHPLADQLGSTDGLVTLNTATMAMGMRRVDDRASLNDFLGNYQNQRLLSIELPVIYNAYFHTRRYELRELIHLDNRLGLSGAMKDFASSSQRIGKFQLRRLRPLRDQRMARRYLSAVEEGEARGWHLLVYGLTLELYSMPLRQGLLTYAYQALRGFVNSGARRLDLSEEECRRLFTRFFSAVPPRLEKMLRVGVDFRV